MLSFNKPRASPQKTNIGCRTKNGEASFGIVFFVQAPLINKNPKLFFREAGSIVSKIAVMEV
jgi:hypothetical protein